MTKLHSIDEVVRVTFTVYFADGAYRVVEFIRPEKIDDLFDDPGSLGAFLYDLATVPTGTA